MSVASDNKHTSIYAHYTISCPAGWSNQLLNAVFNLQVISARKGEFETGFEKGGQTREHAMLAKTAGVRHLVVLVNKMDDSTVNWSLERWVQV